MMTKHRAMARAMTPARKHVAITHGSFTIAPVERILILSASGTSPAFVGGGNQFDGHRQSHTHERENERARGSPAT